MAKKKITNQTKQTQKTKLVMKAKQSLCQKKNLVIDFKPNKKHDLYKDFKDIALYPVFNKDKKYFTPTFVLRFFDHLQSDQELRKLHQKKLVEYTTEIECDKILFPKPRSKNLYCGVCRQTYEDYYSHVHTEQHRQQAKTSRFTKYINQLCVKFNPNLQKEQKQLIENELNELMDKYKNQDTNHWNVGSSYESCGNKSKKGSNPNIKKETSISYSNHNNRTTIILSSD